MFYCIAKGVFRFLSELCKGENIPLDCKMR